MSTSLRFSVSKKGFTTILFLLVVIVVAGIVGGAYFFKTSQNNSSNSQPFTSNSSSRSQNDKSVQTAQPMINPYLGVPCTSNPNPTFTHDFTEADKISKITPNSLIASKSQDRVFLWIDIRKTDKVPVYAPVDADLVRGVYKVSKSVETIDYDLHFQVSCEVWFFINHVSSPVDKIKELFPSTPATSANAAGSTTTSDNINKISPPLHFNAGELIGYTTGTAQAHNFDFAVFDLNHTNTLIGQGGSNDTRFKNFICPFDVLPENLKNEYYKKLDPSLISESNCK